MTTIHTITDSQIRALRAEAGAAGDRAQVAICDRALGTLPVERIPDLPRAMSKAEARAECARVIAEAQAMQD